MFNRGLFLCGRRSEEVLQMGYHFYQEVIHPDDYRLMVKIHKTIMLFFQHSDTPLRDLSYVVLDIRMRG